MDQVEPAVVEGAVPCRLGEARLTHGVEGDQSVVPGDERFEELQLHTRPGRVAEAERERRGRNSAIWAAERPGNRTGDRPDREMDRRPPRTRRGGGGRTLGPVGADALVTKDVERVADCIAAGGLAVVPTETVYGLAADAEQPAAVARIFEVKGRPPTHPLIVHVGAADDLPRWVDAVPVHAAVLAETCWPGPLTLLLHRSSRVPDAVTGGRDTVGVRVPAHPATLQVLARTGGGLAAPSANRYGAVSPTTVGHVLDELGDSARSGDGTSSSTAVRARWAWRARSSTAPSTHRRSCDPEASRRRRLPN